MSIYLVTGGGGFIGSAVVRELLRRGEQVRVVDNFLTGRRENLAEVIRQIELREVDITDAERLRPAFEGVDYVLHLAALPSVPRSVQAQAKICPTNWSGQRHVGQGSEKMRRQGRNRKNLSGVGAECEGDTAEGGLEGKRMGQVQHDAADRNDHPSSEFQQALAQSPDLRSRASGPRCPQSQFLQQDIGSRAEQNPKLIGPEIGATGAANTDPLVQFLDPVFGVPALTIDLFVNPAGALGLIGDDESRVIFGVLALLPHHFGFEDDAPRVRPRSGGIAGFRVDVLGFPAAARQPARFSHGSLRPALQDRVAGHRHHVFDIGRGLEPVQQLGMRKAAVEPDANRRAGKEAGMRRTMRHKIPAAPSMAGALPGRNTAASRYCSGSSLKLTKAIMHLTTPTLYLSC